MEEGKFRAAKGIEGPLLCLGLYPLIGGDLLPYHLITSPLA